MTSSSSKLPTGSVHGGQRTPRPLPPLDEIKALLDYDRHTGQFQWKPGLRLRGRKLDRVGTIRAGYVDICIRGIHYGLHRVAWKYAHGVDPDGEVDHINGVRTDNRLANLRDVTITDNRRNAAMPRTNTSGRVGVSWRGDKDKWLAYIGIDNRHVCLGYFATKEEAIKARAAKECELGFHPNHGRALCL